MGGYYFSIDRKNTRLNFINDTGEKKDTFKGKWSHYPILHKLLNYMGSRGFEVGKDPRIERDYKCLGKDHWYGRKGQLEFKAERYPRGFELQFYQNVNFENPHGGEYDFDKYEKMPYLIRLMFINETNKMAAFLESLGIKNDTSPRYKLAEDKIKNDFVNSWHHPQKDMNFKLSDLDGQTDEYSYNKTDRDRKTIYNGQIKYFRHWNGRLMRGKVYHNINNMWWVIINDTTYRNIADFELFDPTLEDFKIRRKARSIKPKEYLEKLESLQKLSNKELIRELKKRGVKVS